MSNEPKLKAALAKCDPQSTRDEIEDFRQSGRPLAEAVIDVLNFAEQHNDWKIISDLRDVFVELGELRELPAGARERARQLSNAGASWITRHRGKDYEFLITDSDFEIKYDK